MAVLETIGSILGIAGALAGAVGILFGAKSKAAMESLKADNDALRGLLSTRDAVIDSKDEQISALSSQNHTLREASKIMQDMLTGAPEIAKLVAVISKQHAQVLKELGKVAHGTSELGKVVSQLITAIGKDRTIVITDKDKVQEYDR